MSLMFLMLPFVLYFIHLANKTKSVMSSKFEVEQFSSSSPLYTPRTYYPLISAHPLCRNRIIRVPSSLRYTFPPEVQVACLFQVSTREQGAELTF